jgi:hypothetical protein
LPEGKPAGVRCPHLQADVTCALFGRPERPAVCTSLRPQPEMCGDSAAEAMATLVRWETLTRRSNPDRSKLGRSSDEHATPTVVDSD